MTAILRSMQIGVLLQIRRLLIPALVRHDARHDLADIALVAIAVVIAADSVQFA